MSNSKFYPIVESKVLSLGSLGEVQTSPSGPNETPFDLITYDLKQKTAHPITQPYKPNDGKYIKDSFNKPLHLEDEEGKSHVSHWTIRILQSNWANAPKGPNPGEGTVSH